EMEGLKPGYAQKDFSKEISKGKLFLAASKDGRDGSITINQNADLYLAKLQAGASLELPFNRGGKGWLQLASGELKVGNQLLKDGDGISFSGETPPIVQILKDSHLLYFDLPK